LTTNKFMTVKKTEQGSHHNVTLKDDRQRFLQKVSKEQFRTVYYNANTSG